MTHTDTTQPLFDVDVVVVTVGCSQMHLTETLMISPVLDTDGQVESGLLNSSANYCQVCDEPAEMLAGRLDRRSLNAEDADTHRVRWLR